MHPERTLRKLLQLTRSRKCWLLFLPLLLFPFTVIFNMHVNVLAYVYRTLHYWHYMEFTKEDIIRYLHNYTVECELKTGANISAISSLPLCSCMPPEPTKQLEVFNQSRYDWKELESILPKTEPGGFWRPPDCAARHRVAIIIPYRNREEHLKVFIEYMHPFLQQQRAEYQIFIVDQKGPKIFNRATLMNIGYVEAKKLYNFNCYIFHDVDLLPESYLNLYTCVRSPLHLGAYMHRYNYTMPYPIFFGGAVALSPEQMESINGFSNQYFGWGGEDDDTYNRVIYQNMTVYQHLQPIGKSYSMSHTRDKGNPHNPKRNRGYQVLKAEYKYDGLNTLIYTRNAIEKNKLFTTINVTLYKPIKRECIVDHSKRSYEPGNYLDCMDDDENFQSGNIDCCLRATQVRSGMSKFYPYCCNKDIPGWLKLLLIVGLVAMVTTITVVVVMYRRGNIKENTSLGKLISKLQHCVRFRTPFRRPTRSTVLYSPVSQTQGRTKTEVVTQKV